MERCNLWKSILKKPITIGTTRIGLKPIPEEEDECNIELHRYADKLRNMKGQLKVSGKFMQGHKFKDRLFYNIIGEGEGSWFEDINFLYTPIPEEVACRALEMLKNATAKRFNSDKIEEYNIYTYHKQLHRQSYSSSTYSYSGKNLSKYMQLTIYIGSSPVVNLGYTVRTINDDETNYDGIDIDWRK